MRLTEEERASLHDTLIETGCMGFREDHPELDAAVEEIIEQRLEKSERDRDYWKKRWEFACEQLAGKL